MQSLPDKQEIYEVLLRYCRGVDRCDEIMLQSVYHPNAHVEHGAFKGTAADFIPWILGRICTDESMMHCLGNVLIDINGDKATSEAYFIGYFRKKMENAQLVDHIIGARYIDRFERQDQHWRKINQVIVCDWSRLDPVKDQSPIGLAYRKGLHSTRDFVYENENWQNK